MQHLLSCSASCLKPHHFGTMQLGRTAGRGECPVQAVLSYPIPLKVTEGRYFGGGNPRIQRFRATCGRLGDGSVCETVAGIPDGPRSRPSGVVQLQMRLLVSTSTTSCRCCWTGRRLSVPSRHAPAGAFNDIGTGREHSASRLVPTAMVGVGQEGTATRRAAHFVICATRSERHTPQFLDFVEGRRGRGEARERFWSPRARALRRGCPGRRRLSRAGGERGRVGETLVRGWKCNHLV